MPALASTRQRRFTAAADPRAMLEDLGRERTSRTAATVPGFLPASAPALSQGQGP
jgi:hypothetical protein